MNNMVQKVFIHYYKCMPMLKKKRHEVPLNSTLWKMATFLCHDFPPFFLAFHSFYFYYVTCPYSFLYLIIVVAISSSSSSSSTPWLKSFIFKTKNNRDLWEPIPNFLLFPITNLTNLYSCFSLPPPLLFAALCLPLVVGTFFDFNVYNLYIYLFACVGTCETASFTVVYERTNGIKQCMQTTFTNLEETSIEQCSHKYFKPLLYVLTFFHASMQVSNTFTYLISLIYKH